MDYYGLLFLYYLKGLSGKSILRLFFNIEAGGTEQLLPENTSVPTTTPILADTQYPDGLRTDQYFTYRKTPTTISNKARIKTIKGNTLVWNQLVQNGNFADTSNWSTYSSSFTVSGNIATIVGSGNNANINQTISCVSGHKYYAKADLKGNTSTRIIITGTNLSEEVRLSQSANYETVGLIFTVPTSTLYFNISQNGSPITFYAKNVMLFDLTQMGLDITDPSDFTSLFSLPYYAYNQGSLLSFNGNGIKTVGFNKWDEEWEVGNISPTTGSNTSSTDRIRPKNYIPLVKGESYFFKGNANLCFYDGNKTFIGTGQASNSLLSIPDNASYLRFICFPTYGLVYKNDICVNISKTGENGKYEPYTSSTLSLPISTYFPTGMKSAGSVYDELTESKAITRVGSVDLGSLTWTYDSSVPRFYSSDIQNIARKPESASIKGNVVCPKYITETIARLYLASFDHVIALSNTGSLNIKDTNYNSAETLKNSLQGVYLYYELETPIETPIITEDANEALSLLMGKSVSSSNAKQMIDIITKGE